MFYLGDPEDESTWVCLGPGIFARVNSSTSGVLAKTLIYTAEHYRLTGEIDRPAVARRVEAEMQKQRPGLLRRLFDWL